MEQRWVVIYMWRGERHRDLDSFATREAALSRLTEYRRGQWVAWIEELQPREPRS